MTDEPLEMVPGSVVLSVHMPNSPIEHQFVISSGQEFKLDVPPSRTRKTRTYTFTLIQVA